MSPRDTVGTAPPGARRSAVRALLVGHSVLMRDGRRTAVLSTGVVLVCATLASCTSSGAPSTLESGSPSASNVQNVAACQASDLDVSVDATDMSIRVKNVSSGDCSLTGSPPASMKLGRVDGPSPEQTTVVVPGGRVYVQPQVQLQGVTACPTPWPSGAPRTDHWSALVQGDTFHPTGPGQLMVNVGNCFAYTRPPGFTAP